MYTCKIHLLSVWDKFPHLINSWLAIYINFVSPLSANSATSFQQVPPPNGNHMAATSDLPQLTGEDLQILDAFDPVPEGDQFGHLMYQQPPLNYSVAM